MYQIVMEDDLLLNYFQFKNGKNENSKLTESLLAYYKPFLTNIKQLKRINYGDDSLKQQLASAGYTNQTLEELVKKTSLKIILSNEKDNYPYININKDKIEVNYTGTFKKNESRTKCVEHLKELCKNAKEILICDNYLNKNMNILENIFDFLPNEISIYYEIKEDLPQDFITKWKQKKNIKKLAKNNYNEYKFLHDRYLLIDSKIEIILTSGFDYLFNNNKDLTYIVRKIK